MKKATNIKNGNMNIKCEYCGGCGYHKMSCPTQKATIWFDEDSFIETEMAIDNEMRKRFIDKAAELQNECEEYMQKIREKLK